MLRCLLFYPDGSVGTYVGMRVPLAKEYPAGTYRYVQEWVTDDHSGWTVTNNIHGLYAMWELAHDVPKEIQLLALIHP